MIVDTFPHHTETFIKDHIEGLGADVFSVYCPPGAVDSWQWRSRPFIRCAYHCDRPPRTLLHRAIGRVRETIVGLPAPSWPSDAEREWDAYVREREPTVALAEFGPSGICALPACQRTGVPLVVHFHGYDASSLLRSARYRSALGEVFAEADAVVVVSEAMRARLLGLGCPDAKLAVIRCGSPANRFTLGNAARHQPCQFLAVGRLIPMKGVLETLRAFEICADAIDGVRLTVCGDGPLRKKCLRLARRSSHAARIRMLGHVEHDRVAEELARAGVFLQHSRSSPRVHSMEGSPVAIAEAALSGLPVVSTWHGGVPDLVRHEETGLLVKEGDVGDMAACMIRLAGDPDLRHRMGTAARQHAMRVANQDIQLRRLRSLLEDVQRNQRS